MSNTNPGPQPKFIRRSEKESICTFCALTIRADPYTKLEDAEEIHADLCLVRPDLPARYAML